MNMVVFLFFIFVVEDLCVLVGWVDIVCYYGVFNGCVFEFNLWLVLLEMMGFDFFMVFIGGGWLMVLCDVVVVIYCVVEDFWVVGLIVCV